MIVRLGVDINRITRNALHAANPGHTATVDSTGVTSGVAQRKSQGEWNIPYRADTYASTSQNPPFSDSLKTVHLAGMDLACEYFLRYVLCISFLIVSSCALCMQLNFMSVGDHDTGCF